MQSHRFARFGSPDCNHSGEFDKDMFKSLSRMVGGVLMGLFVNISMVLGIWTPTTIKWTGIKQRADASHLDDEHRGDALTAVMDTVGRMAGLTYFLLPPFFAPVAKLAEAANEAPVAVFSKEMRREMDPFAVRLLVTIINLTSFGFQVHAAANSDASSLAIAVALAAVRDLVVKMTWKLFKLARRVGGCCGCKCGRSRASTRGSASAKSGTGRADRRRKQLASTSAKSASKENDTVQPKVGSGDVSDANDSDVELQTEKPVVVGNEAKSDSASHDKEAADETDPASLEAGNVAEEKKIDSGDDGDDSQSAQSDESSESTISESDTGHAKSAEADSMASARFD